MRRASSLCSCQALLAHEYRGFGPGNPKLKDELERAFKAAAALAPADARAARVERLAAVRAAVTP
jgi:hypothetical protein